MSGTRRAKAKAGSNRGAGAAGNCGTEMARRLRQTNCISGLARGGSGRSAKLFWIANNWCRQAGAPHAQAIVQCGSASVVGGIL